MTGYFLNTNNLAYGGSFIDGEYHAYPIDKLPDDVRRIFNETYDYDRLTKPPVKLAEPVIAAT